LPVEQGGKPTPTQLQAWHELWRILLQPLPDASETQRNATASADQASGSRAHAEELDE
jgi:hypothetical protein